MAWGMTFPPSRQAAYAVARRLLSKHVEAVVSARVAQRRHAGVQPHAASASSALDAVDLLLNASDEHRDVVAPPDDPSWSETSSNKVRGGGGPGLGGLG